MVARCCDRIAVVLDDTAHVDSVLAELTLESLAEAGARVGHIDTLALPSINMVVTDCLIATRRAETLVDISIAVASQCERGFTLPDVASICVRADEVISAHSVGESGDTIALVRMNGD